MEGRWQWRPPCVKCARGACGVCTVGLLHRVGVIPSSSANHRLTTPNQPPITPQSSSNHPSVIHQSSPHQLVAAPGRSHRTPRRGSIAAPAIFGLCGTRAALHPVEGSAGGTAQRWMAARPPWPPQPLSATRARAALAAPRRALQRGRVLRSPSRALIHRAPIAIITWLRLQSSRGSDCNRSRWM